MRTILVAVLLMLPVACLAQSQIYAFGDSNGDGSITQDITSYSDKYVYKVGQLMHWTVVNRAQQGSMLQEDGQCGSMLGLDIPSSSLSFGELGYNDMRNGGTDADKLAVFTSALYACTVYMAQPTVMVLKANNAALNYVGSWGGVTTIEHFPTRQSSAGATVSGTINGTVAYIVGIAYTGSDPTISVSIDGVSQGTCTTSMRTTGHSINYGPWMCRKAGLSAGSHTVTVTASDSNFRFGYMTGNITGGPWVFFSGPVKMTAAGYAQSAPDYSNGTDTVVANYNTAVLNVMTTLNGDGFKTHYVNVSSVYDPATMVSSDTIHFLATGHTAIANQFAVVIDSILVPGGMVLKGNLKGYVQ